MKRLIIAAVALSALAGAAAAQPAYKADDGSAPDHYPPCAHRGQDRCIAERGGRHMKHWTHKASHHRMAHHHMMKSKAAAAKKH